MPLVTDLPEELREALAPFREHFGAPAFEHFQRYVLGLMISQNLTVEGINRIFIDRRHPSSLNRFLTWAVWEEQGVNRKRLKEIKAAGEFKGRGWLLLDDTLTHKTGRSMEAVGTFWDHSDKRYVQGHNIVTAQFVSRKGAHHPVGFRVYLKREHCEKLGIPFKTKIQLAEELVEEALAAGLEVDAVLFDSWFASKEFIGFLRGRTLGWVTRLKSDRNVKIRGRYMRISDFGATLGPESFKQVVVNEQSYWVFSKAVDLKGVGRVRIVISHDNADLEGDPSYFAADKVDWGSTRILRTYSKRSKIEAFYRDSKQNLGLEDYQLRDLRAIKRHWCLVFLAYSLLVRGLPGIDAQTNTKRSPTLGERIASTTQSVFTTLVGWIVMQWNQGKSEEQIARIAFGY